MALTISKLNETHTRHSGGSGGGGVCLYSLQCSYYFSAWIEEAHIKPYEVWKDKLKNASKSVNFKEAVDAIEAYINDPDVSSNGPPPPKSARVNYEFFLLFFSPLLCCLACCKTAVQ